MKLLLLLLQQTPPAEKGGMDFGAIMAPILSGLAFILSSAAFVFTVIIQLKERKRNIRQTLSVALSEVARINVEISKLRKDEEVSPQTAIIQKNYSSQRGTLVSDADFLIKQNDKLVTDADCELMALTYGDFGDIPKAEEYWLKAIDLSDSPQQQHLHQRNYAAFLYHNNQLEKGREFFEKSLINGTLHNDDYLLSVADSYVTWAQLERNFDNVDEFNRLIKEAKSYSQKIQHKRKRDYMVKLIDHAINSPT